MAKTNPREVYVTQIKPYFRAGRMDLVAGTLLETPEAKEYLNKQEWRLVFDHYESKLLGFIGTEIKSGRNALERMSKRINEALAQ